MTVTTASASVSVRTGNKWQQDSRPNYLIRPSLNSKNIPKND